MNKWAKGVGKNDSEKKMGKRGNERFGKEKKLHRCDRNRKADKSWARVVRRPGKRTVQAGITARGGRIRIA
jgi:hypothetical protein